MAKLYSLRERRRAPMSFNSSAEYILSGLYCTIIATMVSVIFPANDYSLAAKLVASLNSQYPEAEVTPVFGANSFFDAWKKGLKKTKGNTLIFTHQDVEFD